jgi:hypothetical protein
MVTDVWNPWTRAGGVLRSGPAATSWATNHVDVVSFGLNGSLYRNIRMDETWSGHVLVEDL